MIPYRYSVLLFNEILGLYFLGRALFRPQVHERRRGQARGGRRLPEFLRAAAADPGGRAGPERLRSAIHARSHGFRRLDDARLVHAGAAEDSRPV